MRTDYGPGRGRVFYRQVAVASKQWDIVQTPCNGTVFFTELTSRGVNKHSAYNVVLESRLVKSISHSPRQQPWKFRINAYAASLALFHFRGERIYCIAFEFLHTFLPNIYARDGNEQYAVYEYWDNNFAGKEKYHFESSVIRFTGLTFAVTASSNGYTNQNNNISSIFVLYTIYAYQKEGRCILISYNLIRF